MKCRYSSLYLAGIKFGDGFRETFLGLFLKCSEKFSACAVFHHEIDVFFGLKRVNETHDNRMQESPVT